MNNLDLENIRQAKTSHIKWFSYVELFEQDIFSFKDRIAVIKTESGFGKWYYGTGQKFSNIASFKHLEDFNSIVHEQYIHILKHLKTPVKKKSFLLGGGVSPIRKEELDKLISGLRTTSKNFVEAIESFEKDVLNKIEIERKKAIETEIAEKKALELKKEEKIKQEDTKLGLELSSTKLDDFLSKQRETQDKMSKVAQRIADSKLEIERKKNELSKKITESRIEIEAKKMEIAGQKKKIKDAIPIPIVFEEEMTVIPTEIEVEIEHPVSEIIANEVEIELNEVEIEEVSSETIEEETIEEEEIIETPEESDPKKGNTDDIDFDEEMKRMMR